MFLKRLLYHGADILGLRREKGYRCIMVSLFLDCVGDMVSIFLDYTGSIRKYGVNIFGLRGEYGVDIFGFA
jgi:hypothetical protein